MVFLKQQNEDGEYVNAAGEKFTLLYGDCIFQPGKEMNEGCDTFETLEVALESYGLTKVEEKAPEMPEAPEA